MKQNQTEIAVPFVKWAGGKRQLLDEIEKALPVGFEEKEITYIEPFVGGGAVMFWMLNKYPNIKKAVINDVNTDLINCYQIIQNNVEGLIKQLKTLEKKYHVIQNDKSKQLDYYKENRSLYNSRRSRKVKQAALFIFLNKTCFNGIYRVNQSNGFNVPMGDKATPRICHEENLRLVHKLLQKVEIQNGDFEETIKYAEGETFFYFDPPYKPLSKTSSFNSYTKDEFNDVEQTRLRDFCKKLNSIGYVWMQSNSDVKGKNPTDNFFDDLYVEFNISRVQARRSLNADGEKRGKLNELLITNYHYEQVMSVA